PRLAGVAVCPTHRPASPGLQVGNVEELHTSRGGDQLNHPAFLLCRVDQGGDLTGRAGATHHHVQHPPPTHAATPRWSASCRSRDCTLGGQRHNSSASSSWQAGRKASSCQAACSAPNSAWYACWYLPHWVNAWARSR